MIHDHHTHTHTDRQTDRQTSIMDTESMMILTSSLTAQHHLKLILHTDTHTQTVHWFTWQIQQYDSLREFKQLLRTQLFRDHGALWHLSQEHHLEIISFTYLLTYNNNDKSEIVIHSEHWETHRAATATFHNSRELLKFQCWKTPYDQRNLHRWTQHTRKYTGTVLTIDDSM